MSLEVHRFVDKLPLRRNSFINGTEGYSSAGWRPPGSWAGFRSFLSIKYLVCLASLFMKCKRQANIDIGRPGNVKKLNTKLLLSRNVKKRRDNVWSGRIGLWRKCPKEEQSYERTASCDAVAIRNNCDKPDTC